MQVIQDSTSPANITSSSISVVTEGSPDMSEYVLSFDGTPSDPIDKNANAAGVSTLVLIRFFRL